MRKFLSTFLLCIPAFVIADDVNVFTTQVDVTEVVDEVRVIFKGGWRDHDFWIPKAICGSGISRRFVENDAGITTSDTTYLHAYNDGGDAYVLSASIDPNRLEPSDIDISGDVDGTWEIVSDTSGACTLVGNVLKGGGSEATVIVQFTDTKGVSRSLPVTIGKFSKQERTIQNPYNEKDNTFRKAYTEFILAKFAPLDWSTGHIFPQFLRMQDRNSPCYFGKEPWELERFSNYKQFARTRSSTWNSSTNFSLFTGGVHDENTKCSYKDTLISYANDPLVENADFFWPALLTKLRCVSGARADWYAQKTSIRIAPHYLLCANHYHQNTHRFFTGANTYVDVTASGGKSFNDIATTATNGIAELYAKSMMGSDWYIEWIPEDGLPNTVPVMEFLGRHGDEPYSSLYNLSPSTLAGAPAIQLTQANTIALAYINTPGQVYTNGVYVPTERLGISHRLSLVDDNYHWINTTYPALNAKHPYYNGKVIVLNESGLDKTDPSRGASTYGRGVTVNDIAEIVDYEPGYIPEGVPGKSFLYMGEHYPIAGDSSRPLMGYYNDHLWLYTIYWFPAGGDSALNVLNTEALDQWIRKDSLTRYGAEEGLTFIDCCDLDPNHTYHTH